MVVRDSDLYVASFPPILVEEGRNLDTDGTAAGFVSPTVPLLSGIGRCRRCGRQIYAPPPPRFISPLFLSPNISATEPRLPLKATRNSVSSSNVSIIALRVGGKELYTVQEALCLSTSTLYLGMVSSTIFGSFTHHGGGTKYEGVSKMSESQYWKHLKTT